MANDKNTPEATKLEMLEAETKALISRNQELEARNAQLEAERDELRSRVADLASAGASLLIRNENTTPGQAPRPVIELGGKWYRIVRPRFHAYGRLINATDLITNTELAERLMGDFPQLFEEQESNVPEQD